MDGAPRLTTRPVQFAVVKMDGSWRILLNGERVGRFESQTDATRCVVEIARTTREDGQPVEVLLQDAFGQISSLSEPAPAMRERAA